MSSNKTMLDHEPERPRYFERIGDQDFTIEEHKLHVFDDVTLWHKNPRLMNVPGAFGCESETDVEAAIRRTRGFDPLASSIAKLGQMEAIYVWQPPGSEQYLILEGATRVTILRDLHRRDAGDPAKQKLPTVRAKVLPPNFSERDRAILLAKIHVRGSGVRGWGRYIEAKFIYDTVGEGDGLMSAADLARHMGKSNSWVSRLRDAYRFSKHFVDYLDSPDAEKVAIDEFSVLEEIAKSREVGPKLKDFSNPNHDQLRADVFDMVKNNVFKEYRDARFMKEFHDDPEKWAQLKSGEKHIANRLALEVKSNSSSLKGKISSIEQQLERSIARDGSSVDEADLEHLRGAVRVLEDHLEPHVRPIRRSIMAFAQVLEEASLSDIRSVEETELTKLEEAWKYFAEQRARYVEP